MEPIIIEFPHFPEEIQLSAERRGTYFRKGKDKIPAKYVNNETTWKVKGKDWVLYNLKTKEFVVKNSLSVGTPKFVSISGNDIMRMFEHTRNKIVDTLKKYFIEDLGTPIGLDDKGEVIYESGYWIGHYPLNISMEIHTFPHYYNWDLDNLWIYNKCFQDAMKAVGMIPDDNIRYITAPAAPRFIPVSREEDRRMVFTIKSETDSRVLNHILYWSTGRVFERPLLPNESKDIPLTIGNLLVSTGNKGKPGDVIIESKIHDGHMVWINIGKKEKSSKVRETLVRLRHQCYQLNCIPTFSTEDFGKMMPEIEEVFMQNGIPVKIL